MSKYGLAAVAASALAAAGAPPIAAWDGATEGLFGRGTPAQRKGCPRGAFLGLCEEGFVVDIPVGDYTRSRRNKAYAVEAVRLIREAPELAGLPEVLWDRVMRGVKKVHNGQMDVVIALWTARLIENS